MLDFKELSKDGQDLELLARELLFKQGFIVQWSGKGPDGGRDLICIEKHHSLLLPSEKRWLVQCKHNATSGNSVGVGDLDDIITSCAQHKCKGYLLVCSTYPSSGVVNRLEAITANPEIDIQATYWDAVRIEQLLSTPNNWPLAQRFFQNSADDSGWRVYLTASPNFWVVNFKGYYFHLSNRVGSKYEHHFDTIKNHIRTIEDIQLPEKHTIRIRSIYYDDKHCEYSWHLDYMYPHTERPVYGSAQIAHMLGSNYSFQYDQIHHFDVIHRSYFEHSDHHDLDHYDYYNSSISDNLGVQKRHRTLDEREEFITSSIELETTLEHERTKGYSILSDKLNSLPFIKVIRSINSDIEHLDKFHIKYDWSEVINKYRIECNNFFSSWFIFNVENVELLHKLVTYFPQKPDTNFSLKRKYIYIPADDHMTTRSERSCDDNEFIFELEFSVTPQVVGNKLSGRSLLNDYFISIAEGIEKFLVDNDKAYGINI